MPRNLPLPMKEELWELNVYTNTAIKTSAAFFSFLRANLVLPSSTPNSNTSTPLLYPSSSQTLPSLRASSLATMTSNPEDDPVSPPNPLDGVPTLVTTILTAEEDKVAALKLVADSIAQQRQYASRSLIFHPAVITAYILVLGVINQYLWKSRGELGVVLTTTAGITMAGLVAIRSYTAPYIHMAEAFNWSFVTIEGEEDIIIGSRYGEEIIGAAILRLERNGSSGGKKKSKGFKTRGEALVRAWAVRIRYRGKGVGTELLEEAIGISREKLGNYAKIGFAAEHANSTMVLPEFFNGGFRKTEARAAKALERTLHESKKKR